MQHKFSHGSVAFQTFSVPPRIDPNIKGHPLTDLTMAFAEAWDSVAMEKYAAALASATLEEIELARPQIFFTLNNVLQRLMDHAVATRLINVDPVTLVDHMLEGVVKEVQSMLGECDKEPRNRYKLRRLASSLDYLSELREFCSVAQSVDTSFSSLEKKASVELAETLDRVEKFRQETASRYPDVAAILPAPGVLEVKATKSLSEADFDLPRLSAQSFKRTLGILGDHGDLWDAADGKNRQKLIEMGRLQPLSQRDGREIVVGVSRLMKDYDRVFNRHGFLADLRCVAVANRFMSILRSDMVLSHTESEIRARRKYLYDTQEEHQKKIEEEIERLPANRLRDQIAASQWQSAANTVSGLLHEVEKVLKDKTSAAFVNFRLESGALVGEMDVGGDAIVIYDDAVVRAEGNHPEAVYAVRMPSSALVDQVPPLEDIRAMMFSQATNYHSLVECLTEIDGEIERDFFFEGRKIVGHNGFDVLGDRISLRSEDAASPAMSP